MTLNEVVSNVTVRVTRLEHGRRFQSRLYSLGIIPGVMMRVIGSFGSAPVRIKIKDSVLTLGREMAAKIEVEEVDRKRGKMKIKMREMKENQKGTIYSIKADIELGRRIREMGIIPGVDIKIMGKAPLYDPVALKVGDSVLTLRNNEADYIMVEIEEQDEN